MESIRLLYRATLDGACDDFRLGRGFHSDSLRGRRAAAAARWLFDPDYRSPLSFADVCAAFGADPERARKWIKGKLNVGS